MASVTRDRPHRPRLHGVPYRLYGRMAEDPRNRGVRMIYRDGVLEIMSPRIRLHETPSARIRIIITTVADRLGLDYEGTGSGLFRRGGDGPFKGSGKQPDQSFSFANAGRLPTDRDPDLDAGDPPPDLWVEVDNRSSSASRLPVYARLGVPEVWQYRSKSRKIRFLQLADDRYVPVDRSLSVPALTPTLVREALDHGKDLREAAWARWLRD